MRHHHSPGIRGQLMWFLCCICLFLLALVWFLSTQLLEPLYTKHIEKQLTTQAESITAELDKAIANGEALSAWSFGHLTVNTTFFDRLATQLYASGSLNSFCVDISDTTMRTIYKIENQSYCNLHETLLSDSANNDMIVSTAVAMRKKCRTTGGFVQTLNPPRLSGSAQLLVGRNTSGGEYTVLVTTSLVHVAEAGRVLSTVLPIAAVLTNAATGSEMDAFAVISDMEKNEKWGSGNDHTKPVFSILDPTYSMSLPAFQTASGASDIMSHTFENYFNRTKGAYIQSRLAEGVLKTCIHYTPIALAEPDNYEARANLMWASSLAINGLLSCGESAAWSVHAMEHELSAFYDITHGAGLALLTPYWMEYVLREENVWKYVEYGVNVWGIDAQRAPMEIARAAIDKTREFFTSIGMPAHLSELGIDDAHFDIMAEKAANGGLAHGFEPLAKEDVLKIFRMAL